MAKDRNAGGLIALAGAAGAALLLARAVAKRERQYDFRDKVVLITGSSRGLGLVLARQLAAQGARLVLCARNADDLEAAESELRSRGADVDAIPCDLARSEDVERMVNQIIDRHGRVDVLINNAGTITVGPIETMKLEDYHYALDTNFWAAVHVAYYVVPHMQERKSGRIVNISSIGGKIGVPHLLPYCAGKFALTGWSRGLRGELMKDGIFVTTVCPGLMRTGSPRNAGFKGQHEAEYTWFSVADSMPGLSMSAEDAAHEIIESTRRGEVETILSLPAKMGVLFDALLPEFSGDLAALASRYLPGPGGVGTRTMRGAESETAMTRSALTKLTQEAAERNNEVAR